MVTKIFPDNSYFVAKFLGTTTLTHNKPFLFLTYYFWKKIILINNVNVHYMCTFIIAILPCRGAGEKIRCEIPYIFWVIQWCILLECNCQNMHPFISLHISFCIHLNHFRCRNQDTIRSDKIKGIQTMFSGY